MSLVRNSANAFQSEKALRCGIGNTIELRVSTLIAMLVSTILTTGLGPSAVVASRADSIDLEMVERGSAEAQTLWRRGFTLGDSVIEGRLQAVFDSLSGNVQMDPAIELRVHVIKSPELNAFCLPDGSVYLFAGLLSELRSLDQVAFILGHEAQHAIGWHAQKNKSQAEDKAALFEVLSMGAGVGLGASGITTAPLINAFSQLGLGLAAAAAINGYGRDLEAESDRIGFLMMRDAQFDTCASVQALEALLIGHDEVDQVTSFFWGSHPRLRDRIEDMQERMSIDCSTDTTVQLAYGEIKWQMTKLTAQLALTTGRLLAARRATERYLAFDDDDPEMHCLRGDALAQSAHTDTLDMAVQAYQRALECADYDYRDPWKGLAQVAAARGDTASSVAHLERYLAEGVDVANRRTMERRLASFKSRIDSPHKTLADSSMASSGNRE